MDAGVAAIGGAGHAWKRFRRVRPLANVAAAASARASKKFGCREDGAAIGGRQSADRISKVGKAPDFPSG